MLAPAKEAIMLSRALIMSIAVRTADSLSLWLSVALVTFLRHGRKTNNNQMMTTLNEDHTLVAAQRRANSFRSPQHATKRPTT